MKLGVRHLGDTAVVTASGELDLEHADRLRDCLAEILATGPRLVVVDFSGATFVDSTILGVLVGARNRIADRMRLVASHPGVLKPFRLTGLDQVFVIRSTLQEALSPA
jgi:anti-sigma B factor antagonist